MALWISILWFACASDETDSGLDDSGIKSIDTAEIDECSDMIWTYDNVGAPFMTTWCTACHSSDLDSQYRAGAPDTVNLDTLEDVQQWNERILACVLNDDSPMPPAGLPSEDDLSRLEEWLLCGAPE